jgi:DNA-directed RNA polymerase subunit RPC12/RpoP
MAKAPKQGKESHGDVFERIFGHPDTEKRNEEALAEQKPNPPEPKPSLQTIGMTDCSVCGAEVSAVLTRSNHPFTACGKCGARTFYNSRVAIDILKRNLRELDHD